MRTIKFRGKKPSNGVWVYGSLVYSNEVDAAIYYQTGKGSVKQMEWVYVSPDTVGQFTGLLDKKGKEIYEGDVLRSDEYPFSCTTHNEYDNYYGAIGWSDEEALFYIVALKNPKSPVAGVLDGITDVISQNMMQGFEVIGNIHEDKWKQFHEYFQEEDKV